MRISLIFSYSGNHFQGSQQQTQHQNTVLNTLISACKKLGIHNTPIASGRTDRDVHASGQVAHLDVPDFWSDLSKLQKMLNRHIHPYIHIKRIHHVDEDFHARFSAKMRHYRYVISHEAYQPWLADYCHFYPSFNHEICNEVLKLFLGEHDFGLFKKIGSETKSDVRTLYEAKVYTYGNYSIISLKGNSFLRSQVRMIVASTLAVLEGKISIEKLQEQIDAKRSHYRRLAPAAGLYLCRVHY